MATLIPALGSCTARMTPGKRRLAERLEQKLESDCLLRYDVPVGPQQLHPDFIVLHPSRGLLILKVKDFRLGTIVAADKGQWTILDGASGEPKPIQSPFGQARHYACAVLNALCADKRLVHPGGRRQGELVFAWSYGVVLPHITRRQFQDAQLDGAIAAHRVVCSDEMSDSVEAEAFQSRLWEMFPYERYHTLTLPQIDRVRWILFPQVRIGAEQASLFDEAGPDAQVPDMLRVMDLQQEQRLKTKQNPAAPQAPAVGRTALALAASPNRSTLRSAGNAHIQPATTPRVQMSPKMAAGTAPSQAALVPARNSPSPLDEPMNSMLTALTRLRMVSGVGCRELHQHAADRARHHREGERK